MKIRTALVLSLLAPAAWAHHFMDDALPRTWFEGLLSGLGHPLIGVDHLAFIIAAGFFLALVPRGAWGIVALIAGALAGASFHLAGLDVPAGEAAVAISVIIVGVLVAARRTVALHRVVAGMAFAGVLHGHAYAESIFGAEPAPLTAYLVGFSVVQLGVAGVAFLLHRSLPHAAVRAAGVAAGAVGAWFLVLATA